MTMRTEVQQFEQLYQEHLDRIYRFVYSHVRNREAAEDLTSQIFLKAMRTLNLEQNALSGSAWLFRVAHTTVADYWRAHYRRVATHSLEELVEAGWEGPSDADPPLVGSKAAECIEDILQALPKRDREVLTCRFLLQLSVRETALSMGVTETNVKVMQYGTEPYLNEPWPLHCRPPWHALIGFLGFASLLLPSLNVHADHEEPQAQR